MGIQSLSAKNLINWGKVKNFKENEFPHGVLDWMELSVLAKLFNLRENCNNKCFMYPSPDPEAHVRHATNTTSRHSTLGKTKLSSATDIFVLPSCWHDVYWKAPYFYRGIGLYLDYFITINGVKRNYPMFHFDTRTEYLQWIRKNGIYYFYNVVSQNVILELLNEARNKWK